MTLKYERGTAFVSELVDSIRLCEDLATAREPDADRTGIDASSAAASPSSTRCGRSRSATSRSRRAVRPGAGAMVMKLAYSEARQRFGELCLRVLDRDALHVDGNELVEERLRTLALTIAAGASQIQRNIIGERVLGLPREPR